METNNFFHRLRKETRDMLHEIKMGIQCGDVGLDQVKVRKKQDTPEDLNSWQSYINRWAIWGPMPIKLLVHMSAVQGEGTKTKPTMGIHIKGHLFTRDRGDILNNTATEVYVSKYAPTARPNRYSDRWLRALCRELYLHELDEWIKIGGERKFDPHGPNAGRRL